MNQKHKFSLLFKVVFVLSFLMIALSENVEGQVYKWRKLRYELLVGGGVTNFMGDVGAPANTGLGKYFWTNVYSWRPTFEVGGRFAIAERQKVKLTINAGWLYANDAYGAQISRNFEIRTFITEVAASYEFYVLKERNKKNIYKALGLSQRFANFTLPTYFFIGVGGTYFNPKTLWDGKWVALQPYHTEIYKNGAKSYKRIALVIPFGMGVSFKLTQYTSINVEAGWRVALTDYLDDVGSGKYPDFTDEVADGKYTRMALSWRGHFQITDNEDLHRILKENVGLVKKTNRSAGDWFDQYQFVNVRLVFKLKTGKKGVPTLKMYK